MKHSTTDTTSSATVLGSLPARSRRGCGHALSVLAMTGTVFVAAPSASADFVTADWESTCAAGVWTDMCWGAEPMPNNGSFGHTYHAIISDGISTVTQNISITLDRLSVFPLNTMILQNNNMLSIVGGPAEGGLTGHIGIDGVLVMGSIGNFTDLTAVAGPAGSTLMIVSNAGTGELRMGDSSTNRIYGATSTETIMFGAGLTVAGSGQIGEALTTLINQGTIVADQSTMLRIWPNAGGMTNSGLMVARDGGLLQFNSGVYDNALGEIRAEDLSTVRFLLGSQITGGLMVAQSGGLFEFFGGSLSGGTVRIDVGGVGQVTTDSTVLNLTNDGMVIINNGTSLHTGGQLNNSGSFSLNSLGNFTDLILDSDTVLVGGGTINMSSANTDRIYSAGGGHTFTNIDNTIRGSGQIGEALTPIINQGTIVADQSTMLRIWPNAGGMTNSGTLRAENAAELRLRDGPFTTSGSVSATTGSTIMRVASDYIQTAGSSIIDGTLTLNAGGTVTLNGGVLGGSGQVNAHVNNIAGTAAPGSSVGRLIVNGNYTQGINAGLDVEIAGTETGQRDILTANLNATLAGTLEVTFVDGFVPLVGQTFTIISADSVSGEFGIVNSCAGLSVTYNPTNVVLTITSECPLCLGDTNGDSMVNVTDLLSLLGGWGTNPGHAADFNDDGEVNVTDLLVLLAAWGVCP